MFRMTAMDLRPGATDYLLSQMGCEDELDTREKALADAAQRGDAVAYYQNAENHGESPGRWRGRAAALLGLVKGQAVTEETVKTVLGELRDPATGEQLGSKPRRYETREARYAKAVQARPHLTAEQRRELWNEITDQSRSATGFYDLTFMAQKSVSVYQAAAAAAGQQHLADAVQRAHRTAVDAAMDHLERNATWTRVGEHRRVPGGRTSGTFEKVDQLVAVEFDHSTSRSQDPHLHTHVAVANRVPCADGQWRAIHAAAWRGAKAEVSAIYERTLAQQIEAHTPARFVVREDGLGREIAGIDQAVLEASSQRTREVERAQSAAVAEFRETYGRAPTAAERSRIHRQAGLSSRAAKTSASPHEQLAEWAERVDPQDILRQAAGAGRDIERFGRPDADALPDPTDRDAVARAALHLAQSRAATFTHGELVAAIEQQLPMTVEDPNRYARELSEEILRSPRYDVLSISRPEPLPVPDWWRDHDGRPVWSDPAAGRYTTRQQLSTEQDLVVTARQHTHQPLAAAELRDADEQLRARGLNDGQRHAVLGVLGSPRAADALVSGAGTGKSFTVGQLAQQWEQRTGGRVLGLATSQIATEVLQEDGLKALNTSVFLTAYEPDPRTGIPRERLGHRDLLVVDESNMSSTSELARIQRIAQAAGAKLLYTGDPQQLQAVGAGGALGLIAGDNGCFELTEVRRFSEDWEKDASLELRSGNVDVLSEYELHGRLRGGTAEEMRQQAVRAYLADTMAGKSSLLICRDNASAAEVSALTQQERQRLEQLGEALPHTLMDGNAVHVGDLVQARENNYSVRCEGGLSMVTNRERYIVVGGDEDQLLVERVDGAGRAWLPREYVSEHTTLGYAGTEHAAEGMTVDTGHALHPGYVALTRGRECNTAYMTTYTPGDAHGPAAEQTPREVLAAALERSATEQTAVEQLRAEMAAAEHTASLVGIWDHVNREVADYRHGQMIGHHLGADAADRIEMEDGRRGLYEALRRAEMYGHDAEDLLVRAIHERPLDRVDDLAAVLRHRIDQHIGPRPATSSWTERCREERGLLSAFEREVAGMLDSRQRELGRQAGEQQPEWAVQALGPVPDEELQRAEWDRRAGAIAAYRELQQMPDERLTLGARPHDLLAQLSYDNAAEAAGIDPTALEYSTADEATLQEWVQRAERAAAWAPEYVHDELGQAREVTARRSAEITLLRARAEVAEPAEAERLRDEIARSQDLLERLQERERMLTELHTSRQAWLTATAEVRERGEEARQELTRRDAGSGTLEQHEVIEQQQLLAVSELMPSLSSSQLADVQKVADRNAEQDAAERLQQQLGRAEVEQEVTPAAEVEASVDEQQLELFPQDELADPRGAAAAEAVQVGTGELESSRQAVRAAAPDVLTVHEAQIKARYAAEMLSRHEVEQIEDEEQARHAREAQQARNAERSAQVEASVDEQQQLAL